MTTGAELRTLRERCGASIDWLAVASGVTPRSIHRWELDDPNDQRSVPDDVVGLLADVADRQAELGEAMISLIEEIGAAQVVLLAYRTQADFDSGGNNEEGWSPQMHRVVLGRAQEAFENVRIVWFDRLLYDAWRAVNAPGQIDSTELRSQWAAAG